MRKSWCSARSSGRSRESTSSSRAEGSTDGSMSSCSTSVGWTCAKISRTSYLLVRQRLFPKWRTHRSWMCCRGSMPKRFEGRYDGQGNLLRALAGRDARLGPLGHSHLERVQGCAEGGGASESRDVRPLHGWSCLPDSRRGLSERGRWYNCWQCARYGKRLRRTAKAARGG